MKVGKEAVCCSWNEHLGRVSAPARVEVVGTYPYCSPHEQTSRISALNAGNRTDLARSCSPHEQRGVLA
jgi:hypothetical protein